MKIGVVLPHGEDERRGRPPPWADLRALALAAEEAALDSVWVYDHLLFRFPGSADEGIHEAWTLLSAVAEATERVELGTVVLAAPFRSPALTAKMAATLDEVSGGRLILGIGAGWHEPEFRAFGYPFDHRVGRFEEALQIIGSLLRTGRADFHGRYHSARDAVLIPRGPRPSGPPILVAGKRPRMLRLVARHADAWNTAWLGPASDLADRVEPLLQACREVGRDPTTLEITVGVNVAFPHLPGGADAGFRNALSGTAEAIAGGFQEYAEAEAGVGHLIVSLAPATPAGVAELGRATAFSRG